MKVVIVSFSRRSDGNCSSIAEECRIHYGAGTSSVFRFSDLHPASCDRCGLLPAG